MINLDSLIKIIIDIISFFAMYQIAVAALNLQYGYTGIPNFGLALSVAGGGYVAGALTGRIAMAVYGLGNGLDFISDNLEINTLINTRLSNDPLTGIPIFIAIIVIAAATSAGLGLIASYPAIKLRADYLMMVLISMAEALRIIGINYKPLVGGTLFVCVPDLFAWMGDMRRIGVSLIILAISMIVFIVVHALATSPFGRLVRAVRENEVAAECVGKDVTKIRMKVMIVGSVIASLAGVLYAFQIEAVIATGYTRTDWTFWPWLMLMVGGLGNTTGGLIGTIGITLIRRLIIYYKHYIETYIPFQVIWLEQIMLGLVLILVISFKPKGFISEKSTRVRGLRYKKLLEKLDEETQETF